MSDFLSLSTLTSGSYIGAVTLKSLTSAAMFSVINKYLNKLEWKDRAVYRSFIGSFMSSAIAELLMTSIIQRLLSLTDSNAGIKRIFDQGLNAAISGAINIKAYDMLIKSAPNVEGQIWTSHEEFFAQMISDVVGEVLSYYYLVPLFGLNQTSITTVYG
jgi:hypothetical protein